MSKSENNGNAITNHAIGGLFIFCLIALFAVLAVTLTLTGMKAYQSVNEASVGNSEAQIVLSYLLNKTHAMDTSGAVSIQEEQGVEYLCLDEYWDDEVYQTRIYAQDGQMLDECMAVLMRAPRSYTREDVAEIHLHGGSFVAGSVLKLSLIHI